ncbi:protein-lysine methyltransferase METTL21D-like [Coffea eugenioides]|uniref:protein-lysine methyltransferase METTL21D-like n=1 Tax=Coffea eugenioides TaxID=49369 RepID=UPI000F605959|nr:protein-lysine methyltransferase METTL21D-like [Coffea eugenioides]
MGIREIEVATGNKLLIHELEDVCDSVTGRALTGSWIWDAAVVLSNWISARAHQLDYDLSDKTVLELGAGTGLPGLTAARLGASRVVLTDIKPLIPLLEKNVEVNGLGDRVLACQLAWGSDELPSQLNEVGHVDLVLLSDVFFDAAEMGGLAKTLKKVCGKETTVWGATEVRPWTSASLGELESEGFGIVELSSQLSDGLHEEVTGGDQEEFSVFQLVPTGQDCEPLEAWSPIVY